MKAPSFCTVAVMISVIALPCFPIQAQERSRPAQASVSLSADQALQKALAFTGFHSARRLALAAVPSATLIAEYQDTLLPDRLSSVIGKPVWSVKFNSVVLDYAGGSTDSLDRLGTDEYAKDFEITIDAQTGAFIKAVSHYVSPVPGDTTYPWASFRRPDLYPKMNATMKMLDQPPEVNLFEVLANSQRFNQRLAKEVEAYCVSLVWTGEGERPMLLPDSSRQLWFVMTRFIQENQPVCYYQIVDAAAGQIIQEAIGTPSPQR